MSDEIEKEHLNSISLANSAESFAEAFSRIPIFLQIVLVFVVLEIILPQFNSISANLLTPYVDEYISDIRERDKVRKLKKFDTNEFDLSVTELRFISGNDVRLRADPGIKGETLDLLRLGQVVVFIEKEKNWTKVMVQYEDGKTIIGWVFTRYVEKFRKNS